MTTSIEAAFVPPPQLVKALAPAIDEIVADALQEVRMTEDAAIETTAAPRIAATSGVSAQAPASTGAEADFYRIAGMTSMQPNPAFVGLEQQFAELRKRLRLAELARDQARTWRSESELTRTVTIYADPSLLRSLDATDTEVRGVIESGQHVRKPPRIAEERTRRRRRLLRSVLLLPDDRVPDDVDASLSDRAEDALDYAARFRSGRASDLVDEFRQQLVAEETLRLDGNAPQAATNVNRTVNASVDRMLFAIGSIDFSEAEITREELRQAFIRLGVYEIQARRRQRGGGERLPFGSSDDTERELLERYYRETVEANAVADMVFGDESWLDEVRGLFGDDDATRQDLAAFERYSTSLVTGDTATSPLEPSPWARERQRSLRTDEQVRDEFGLQVLETLRAEATIDGVGFRRADISEFTDQQREQLQLRRYNGNDSRRLAAQWLELTDEQVADMRRLARQRSLEVRTDEETLRVTRARVLFEVDAVRAAAEAQIARYRYELSRTEREIEAPLEVVRESASMVPLSFTATLEPKRDGARAVDGVAHTFTWFFVERAGRVPVQLRRQEGVSSGSDTLRLTNPTGERAAYVGGDRAGYYWVEIVRPSGGDEPASIFRSARAQVRVRSVCLRCQDEFYVGAGERRVFGECEWRALPVNKDLVDYRSREQFKPFIMALGQDGVAGSQSGYDYRPDTDDSIVDVRSGTLLLDDRSLLRAANLDQNEVRKRYFEFESVVANIARRFPSVMRQRYGERAATVLETLLAARVRAKNIPFIGAVFLTLDAPTTSTLEEVDNELGNIDEQVTSATEDLLRAITNNASPAEQRARAGTRRELRAEQQRRDAFRVEVLRPLAGIVRRRLDSRLQLDSEAIFDAAAATANAQSLGELPVVAIIQAVLSSPETPLRVAVTRSERRFFGEMAGRMGVFATAFRASSANAELITQYEKNEFEKDGRKVRVFGGAPLLDAYTRKRSSDRRGRLDAAERERRALDAQAERRRRVEQAAIDAAATSEDVRDVVTGTILSRKRPRFYREPTAPLGKRVPYNEFARRRSSRLAPVDRAQQDDERDLNDVLRAETKALADQLLARQTTSDVRASSLWFDRTTGALFGMGRWTSETFFFDRVGQLRLAERLKAASVRTGIANRAQKYIDETYTDERESARNELDVSAALGRPFGVPLSLWLELGNAAAANGIAAAAHIARRIFHVGGIERAFGQLDWRGVHSDANDQPTPYDVRFGDESTADQVTIVRGSERLFSGYNFESINARIQRLAERYRREPMLTLRGRIERLALYYNVLSQFAPKLNSLAVVDVDTIEREMAKIRQ